MKIGTVIGNITQIGTRNHSDLQGLTVGDDHTQYVPTSGIRAAKNIAQGTAASRPASPAVGDVYISTDTGVVNFCISAGAWQTYPSVIRTSQGTQGNIIYFNGTDWVALAPGTSGQFLKTLGAGNNPAWAASSGLVVANAASANYTVNTTQQSIATATLTGGALSATGAVRGRIFISSAVEGNNSNVLTFYLVYGGSNVCSIGVGGVATTTTLAGEVSFILRNNSATNSQQGILFSDFYNNQQAASITSDKRFANGTSAIDSTANQTLAIQVNYPSGATTEGLTVVGYEFQVM